MLPPKTSQHAKFHRDRSNQLGEKRYRNWALDKKNYFVTDGQKRDYLSRDSQCARGATKNPETQTKHTKKQISWKKNPAEVTLMSVMATNSPQG